MSPLATIILTALLSSAVTLLGAWLVYERVIKPNLIESLEAALERTGVSIERRVKRGVVEGLSAAASGEVLRDTTRKVTATGAKVLEEGLGALLGPRKPRDRGD